MRRAIPLLLSAVIAFRPAAALACSCAELSVEDAFARSDAVFVGKVVQLEVVSTTDGVDQILAVVRTGEVFKGNVPSEVEFSTDNGCCYCSYGFEIAKEYLLFAQLKDGRYQTSTCSRSALLGAAAADVAALRRLTGQS